jgi:hypothetical protein|tara:strand:+ start:5200 stop:6264 length:1065 start_codon:yes stop_codon:yes gene_type:complete
MATYNLKFNKDDSVIRHLVVGLLADLNSKLSFWRQISNDERAIIDVPFFYSVTGDENFLKDSFLFSNVNGPGCDPDGAFVDGNYDKIPRGIVNLTSFNVDPSKLINKRNLGNYSMMNEQGLMEGYVAEFEMIPVVLGVDVEILVSSQLDLFKITEAIVKKMYKANFYHVDAGHLEDGTYRISSEYMMPDDYTQERPVEYSFDDKENHKITFSLEINSFIPAFDFEEDIYQKLTKNSFADATTGNYTDPNGFLDPTVSPFVYYDCDTNSKWVSDGKQWTLAETDIDCSALDLGNQLNTETHLKRISRRRKQSNRMFTIGNSGLNEKGYKDEEIQKNNSLLEDNYGVTGTELPFDE